MEVNVPTSNDTDPFISPDDLTLYFTTEPAPAGVDDTNIWMATRPSRSSPFKAPVRADQFNSPYNDQDPYMTTDGREFFFATDRGGNGFEIYRAVRCP